MKRSVDAPSRRIQGRTFIVDVPGTRVVLLNEVGGRVWELLDGARSPADIAAEIAREYDVELEHAERDVALFLDDLCRRGFAQVDAAPVVEPR